MINLPELLAVSDFIERTRKPGAGDGTISSARSIEDWCEARGIDPIALVRYSQALTRSTLETIGREEAQLRRSLGTGEVETAMLAGILTAVQVGIDVERRRRDVRELPC
jgi:hypothetical protein